MLDFHIWTFLGTPVHPFFNSCANCLQCFSLSDCIVISQELYFFFFFLTKRNCISAKKQKELCCYNATQIGSWTLALFFQHFLEQYTFSSVWGTIKKEPKKKGANFLPWLTWTWFAQGNWGRRVRPWWGHWSPWARWRARFTICFTNPNTNVKYQFSCRHTAKQFRNV